MNGITGIAFRETEHGLIVNVKKNSKKSSAGRLKKRLPYNFKQMSKQIMQAKTSNAARPLVTRVQAKLSWLYKKLRSGEYGEREVAAAIIHAAAMERIAKRKLKHLEEEEAAENGSSRANAPGEEEDIYGKNELARSLEENEGISEEMMKEMLDEIEELEKELASDMISELQDMVVGTGGNMSEEELEELKRKHRDEEERQLSRADLKYLKALFDRLEQEKRQGSSGITYSDSGSSSMSYMVDNISELELPDMGVGETVDVSI